jgi:uncharacterized protein (DUF302 family)
MLLVLIGLIAGTGITALLVVRLMLRMMLHVHPGPSDFETTVSNVETAITRAGWGHQRTMALHEKLADKGQPVAFRVALIDLCKPEYAARLLTTDRHVACLMPCTFGVDEADDGRVYITRMNAGLIGRLFGGNIARVMGRDVERDEKAMLEEICHRSNDATFDSNRRSDAA